MEFSIAIKPDEEGYTGRECPNPDCERYFKIKFGTGIPQDVPCHCPYCGHVGLHDEFFTQAQIEYAQSIALNKITGNLIRDLKKHEIKPQRNQMFSISMAVEGKPTPIAYYTEEELEEKVTCQNCTLEYTIYGVFGFCPDCGVHNSLQIFKSNLAIIEKMVHLAEDADEVVGQRLIENALEDMISAYDGFGRAYCKVNSSKATNPNQAERISFQNIDEAKSRIEKLYGFDFAQSISHQEWLFVVEQFQKRHLLAHTMGIIDEGFIRKTGTSQQHLGRKVPVSGEDVLMLSTLLNKIATALYQGVT